MAEGYEVLPELLGAHARTVSALAARLEQESGAARLAALPADAYGVCLPALAEMLNSLHDAGVSAVQSGASCLGAAATSVQRAAQDYATVEDGNALSLRRVKGVG
jgi:hypothetical protein